MTTLIILAGIVVAASAQCNYTSVCSDHTMCKYPTVGPKCTNHKYSGVREASDRQAVVDEHNRLRRIVASGQEARGNPGPQPSAANMNQLQWDTELATVAQRWANQCAGGHDTCRNVQRFYVGQNVAVSGGSVESGNQDWKGIVQLWYNEVSNFDKNNINPYSFAGNTGHYSQVVWADTKYIGCGFATWKGSNGWYYKIYVCNYGPGGNMIGGKMYATGNACSQCSNSCRNSLCQ